MAAALAAAAQRGERGYMRRYMVYTEKGAGSGEEKLIALCMQMCVV